MPPFRPFKTGGWAVLGVWFSVIPDSSARDAHDLIAVIFHDTRHCFSLGLRRWQAKTQRDIFRSILLPHSGL
jgi:hypothetical protein